MRVITIGIDPHKSSHTAVAIDAAGHKVGQREFVVNAGTFGQLMRWCEQWPERRFAIEGAGGLGRTLAQQLAANGEDAVDVPSTLSARARLLGTGGDRKTDPADALHIAQVALFRTDLRKVTAEDQSTILRLLTERHNDLVNERTRITNRLHAVLRDLMPGGAPTRLSAEKAAALMKGIRPVTATDNCRRDIARDLLADLRRLDRQVIQGRPRPGLCLMMAGNRLLLAQRTDPVLFAVVHADRYGVNFLRTGRYRSFVPPLRARTTRAYEGSSDRWAHRFADVLAASPDGPLHDGRWVLSPDAQLRRWNHGRLPHAEYWRSMLIDGDPDAYIDWFVHNNSWEILPLRAMPDADDSRVKAYRKQARDGTLPPVLLLWVSGLDCHLILDGHARLAAAIAESTEPALLELRRTVPQDEAATATQQAVAAYEVEVARFTGLRAIHGPGIPDGARAAGPVLVRRLDGLRTEHRPTWAWPLPGGEQEWYRAVRRHTATGSWEHA